MRNTWKKSSIALALALLLLMPLTALGAGTEMEEGGYWTSPDGQYKTKTGFAEKFVNDVRSIEPLDRGSTYAFTGGESYCIGISSSQQLIGIYDPACIEIGKVYTPENNQDAIGLPYVGMRYEPDGEMIPVYFPDCTFWGVTPEQKSKTTVKDYQCRIDHLDDRYLIGYVNFVTMRDDHYQLYFAVDIQANNEAKNKSKVASSGGLTLNTGEKADCSRCGGKGWVTCSKCGGSGYTYSTYSVNPDNGKANTMRLSCSSCTSGMAKCSSCHGSGKQ